MKQPLTLLKLVRLWQEFTHLVYCARGDDNDMRFDKFVDWLISEGKIDDQ